MTDLNTEFAADELGQMFAFLDHLRESGVTNMFGASPFLQWEFGLDHEMAKIVLASWMRSFDATRQPAQRAEEVLR